MTSKNKTQPPASMARTGIGGIPFVHSLARRAWLAQLGAGVTAAWSPSVLGETKTSLEARHAPAAPIHPHPGLPDPRPMELGWMGQSWRDHGSHPEWSTEWWYVTGWVRTEGSSANAPPDFGFQLTFFRSLVTRSASMTAPLAARHLISAHLAVTDVGSASLLHEERVGRAARNPALSLGEARVGDLFVRMGNWQLRRDGNALLARLPGNKLGLDVQFALTQPPLVQGQDGLSRKGPDAQQISYYYSLPQLLVTGTLRNETGQHRVQGRAWMDHEWSTALMHPDAVGWDWIGMNLQDGGALTAFRLRRANGSTLWTGGSWRASGQDAVQVFGGGDVQFEPLRHWRSPVSKANYPIQWRIHTPAGNFTVRAIVDNQELDARSSTGAIYWEGLCALHDAHEQRVGWGYLEMTGYAHRLRL